MPADRPATDENDEELPAKSTVPDHVSDNDDEDEEEDEDDEEEEPKLKYDKLTANLANVYRNGDSTSTFSVAGDKLVMGTHNGSVHILALPTLKPLRTYHTTRHATVTSVSISPIPSPPSVVRTENGRDLLLSPAGPQGKAPANTRNAASQQQQHSIPNTQNNQIYIATSLLDGYVCISSLVDPKDVQLRNFGRPVQAVALSPDYKNDKTYLSGGLAGNLIVTVGGRVGASTDANTNSAAAAASGWLGSIGLGGQNGRDTILHSGEGSISTIKWSFSGKWVVWVNEEGIKLMRSNIRLGSEDSEDAWKRIAHAARPNTKVWKEMAGVWKARAAWVDDRKLESDELVYDSSGTAANGKDATTTSPRRKTKKFEKLVVGWGDKAWVLHVHEGGTAPGRRPGDRQVGSVDIEHILVFTDCIISGISMYTPSTLAVLAYRTKDDNDKPITAPSSEATSTSKRGKNRRTGLAPELRLVNMVTGDEVDVDELSNVSRFETLSAQDYHLGTLYVPVPITEKDAAEQRGALETVWQVSGGRYAQRMFSSGASVLSRSSSDKDENGRGSFASPRGSIQGVTPTPTKIQADANPFVIEPGLKLFIQSPYDCVLAIKRDLTDHLDWQIKHEDYAAAWQLLDEHPEVIDPLSEDRQSLSSVPDSPSKPKGTLADFFADDASQRSTPGGASSTNSTAQKEKRRIGDLWLQQLVGNNQWEEAGMVAGKILGTKGRWAHWVLAFAQADKFDEITPYIPSTQLKPPLPSLVYEVILANYIAVDRPRLRELLDVWDPELFDVSSVISAIEKRLDSQEVDEDTVEDGVQGRDWRILVEALAKLYLASGRARDALRCYIRAQNADAAMAIIRGEKLLDAIADDIPGVLMLRVSRDQMRSAPPSELEEASSEAVQFLIEEAYRGTVMPGTVIDQLERRGQAFNPFLFFYLSALWKGPLEKDPRTPRSIFERRIADGRALVEDHADLAISLFAEYDRDVLLTFLRAASSYNYGRAAQICEQRHYIPELVHILSRTGETNRALFLIIDELGDVSQAIAFAKENPDLWNDLLDYSMNKPRFIRGLLEEVGTAIDPIHLVRRIPEGLEIDGLRQGIQRMFREYEIQHSISEGVAKVLSGEVGMSMDILRAGRKKAVHFEVVHEGAEHVDLAVRNPPTMLSPERVVLPTARTGLDSSEVVKPGHCVGCGEPFVEDEREPLIGFACGHVFHLTCLLRASPETASDETIDDLFDQLKYDRHAPTGGGDAGEDAAGSRSVGAKVAHAHIIKNVVKGGCRKCIIAEGT